MAFAGKSLAIMAAVALAPAIATPTASATVGVRQIAIQLANQTHLQTVQGGTARGVSIPGVWDKKPAVSHRDWALAAKLGTKARAGTASTAALPARTGSAYKSGSNAGQFAVGALVALALVVAGITATRFIAGGVTLSRRPKLDDQSTDSSVRSCRIDLSMPAAFVVVMATPVYVLGDDSSSRSARCRRKLKFTARMRTNRRTPA